MTIILAVLVFGVIILLHETGHFICARLFRVKINEFSIGFGPRLVSKKKNGIEYSLRALPIGGYVAMEGEDSAGSGSAEELTGGKRRDEAPADPDYLMPAGVEPFNEKPRWQRLIILMAGAAMNVVLGFIILLVVSNFMDLYGTNVVADFTENSPASVYLQADDVIYAVNGCRTRSYNDVTFQMLRDEDMIIDLTVVRDGTKTKLTIPFEYTDDGEGGKLLILGFRFYGSEATFARSLPYAANWTVSVVKQVWFSLFDIITGRYGLNDLSGPVGTATIIEEASRTGADTFGVIVAFITINVGVFNLLPIPGLDGGRILFLIIEMIRRKPVPARFEGVVNAAGLVLLFGLIIVVTFNDIMKLITG